jgi:hypothetical protein
VAGQNLPYRRLGLLETSSAFELLGLAQSRADRIFFLKRRDLHGQGEGQAPGGGAPVKEHHRLRHSIAGCDLPKN